MNFEESIKLGKGLHSIENENLKNRLLRLVVHGATKEISPEGVTTPLGSVILTLAEYGVELENQRKDLQKVINLLEQKMV